MKYMIATADDHVDLAERVNLLIKDHGWEPLGAHAVIAWRTPKTGKQRFEYSQVLINQSEL